MWGHLSEERLLDVVEGSADESARSHAADCAACRARVEEARLGLARGLGADVPEPSPLYWEAFRRQVGLRIEEGRAPRSAGWRLVPGVAALAATVAIAFGLLIRASEPKPVPSAAPTLAPWSPLPPSEDDVGLTVIEALGPTADDLGFMVSCAAEECLASLSDEESRAVAESLKKELSGRTL